MGHHPAPIETGQIVQTSSSGLSPGTWFIILIVVLIVGYIFYKLVKGGEKK